MTLHKAINLIMISMRSSSFLSHYTQADPQHNANLPFQQWPPRILMKNQWKAIGTRHLVNIYTKIMTSCIGMFVNKKIYDPQMILWQCPAALPKRLTPVGLHKPLGWRRIAAGRYMATTRSLISQSSEQGGSPPAHVYPAFPAEPVRSLWNDWAATTPLPLLPFAGSQVPGSWKSY